MIGMQMSKRNKRAKVVASWNGVPFPYDSTSEWISSSRLCDLNRNLSTRKCDYNLRLRPLKWGLFSTSQYSSSQSLQYTCLTWVRELGITIRWMRRNHVAQAARINLFPRLCLRRQDLQINTSSIEGAIIIWETRISNRGVDGLLAFIRRRYLVRPYNTPGHPVAHCTA